MAVSLVEASTESPALGADGILDVVRRRFRRISRRRKPRRVRIVDDDALGPVYFRHSVERPNGCRALIGVGRFTDWFWLEIDIDAGSVRVRAERDSAWPGVLVLCMILLGCAWPLGPIGLAIAALVIAFYLVAFVVRVVRPRPVDERALVAAVVRSIPGLEGVSVVRDGGGSAFAVVERQPVEEQAADSS